jgi:DNA helicase II / ATP-dependent DNA helicase PcrA
MVTEQWFDDRKASLKGARDVSRFKTMLVRGQEEPRVRRAYSITMDILSFRRCSRQYGFFRVRGYVSAQATQLYFGIVIHEVLDRAHRQYRGLIEGKPSSIPTDGDIEEYFEAVTEALKARGIRPYSQKARESAKAYLVRFNSKYGSQLYPRVIDTEHKLRADMRDFYLHGVVDVLAQSENNGRKGGREIWDYKGSKRVEPGSEEMKNYEFQMQVYAGLYRNRNGEYPTRAVLCFLGEEDLDKMLLEISFDEESISKAIEVFTDTVRTIEDRRSRDDWSPPSLMPSIETCGACDIRWDCTTVKGRFGARFP